MEWHGSLFLEKETAQALREISLDVRGKVMSYEQLAGPLICSHDLMAHINMEEPFGIQLTVIIKFQDNLYK